jgi:hypothetical protein
MVIAEELNRISECRDGHEVSARGECRCAHQPLIGLNSK